MIPPRPRVEVASPYGPDGPYWNLHRCAQRLESGDWREVLVLLGGDGTSTHRLAAVTHLLALSMFQQTVGDVERAWAALGSAARILPPTVTKMDPVTGQVTARLQTQTVALPMADGVGGGGHEVRLTLTLAGITWREQTELEQLRNRPHLYSSARDALVRACLEFLIWVEFAPETWRRPVPGEQLHGHGVELPKSLHQPSRKNLCERASKLRKFADPKQGGDVSDSVWADIGGYPGLKAIALEGLAAQQVSSWRSGRSGVGAGFPVRTGCKAAWMFAQECSALT